MLKIVLIGLGLVIFSGCSSDTRESLTAEIKILQEECTEKMLSITRKRGIAKTECRSKGQKIADKLESIQTRLIMDDSDLDTNEINEANDKIEELSKKLTILAKEDKCDEKDLEFKIVQEQKQDECIQDIKELVTKLNVLNEGK